MASSFIQHAKVFSLFTPSHLLPLPLPLPAANAEWLIALLIFFLPPQHTLVPPPLATQPVTKGVHCAAPTPWKPWGPSTAYTLGSELHGGRPLLNTGRAGMEPDSQQQGPRAPPVRAYTHCWCQNCLLVYISLCLYIQLALHSCASGL